MIGFGGGYDVAGFREAPDEKKRIKRRSQTIVVWPPHLQHARASAYTLANIPGLPVVTGGPSTIRIAIDPSDNPTGTEFAIQCAATVDPAWNGQYADAAGRPSPTPVWRTAAQVGQLALPVGYVVTPYCFQVFARNGDLIQTAPSAQGCAATQAATFRGDVNCDGVVNFADINPFVLALANSVAWRGAYPDCALANADVNQDGQVNFADITPFVQCLYGHCP